MKINFVSRVILLVILGISATGQVPTYADTGTARIVKYGQNDIATVHAKLRYSTLIVLPENEEILVFTTGDKDFWIINGGRFASMRVLVCVKH